MSSIVTSSNLDTFEQRKRDHITLSLREENQTLGFSGLDSVKLNHEALPDLSFEDVEIFSYRFGKKIPSPFMISSMTAGHPDAPSLNACFMEACEITGWAMGVGSQRRELTDPEASNEWIELRQVAPHAVLFGNLGITQLIHTPLSHIERLADNLEASGMMIHCNPLQECLQPEGTPNFRDGLHAISKLSKALSVPVIIKETGCGFSKNTLQRLMDTGIAAVDVSGLGGTHWGRIEGARAFEDPIRQKAAETFKNWGISTVESVKNAASLTPNFEIWGSGGVRNGLDAAKLLYLGASTIGFAKPILEAAQKNLDAVVLAMQTIEYELKMALFCTGHRTIEALQESHQQ